MIQTINADALKARLDAGKPTTVIEALPQRYYEASHLPGAINIPHTEVGEKAAQLLPDKDATIVVYCASTECQNSRIAAQVLSAAGYSAVYEYVAGKKEWEEKGYPLETA